MSHNYFKYIFGLLALLTIAELCAAGGKKKGSGTFGPYYQWAASYLPKNQYTGLGHGHGRRGKKLNYLIKSHFDLGDLVLNQVKLLFKNKKLIREFQTFKVHIS